MKGKSKSQRVQWLTVLSGLRGMTWTDLPREFSAGLTLAALVIPLNIGLDVFMHRAHGAIATSVNTTGYFVELVELFESIPHANLYSVAIGLGTFVMAR